MEDSVTGPATSGDDVESGWGSWTEVILDGVVIDLAGDGEDGEEPLGYPIEGVDVLVPLEKPQDAPEGSAEGVLDSTDTEGPVRPPRCPDELTYLHDKSRCVVCVRVKNWANREARRMDGEEAWTPPEDLGSAAEQFALDLPQTAYLIDSLLPEGANLLVAAEAKAGKSTLALNMARALVDGVDLFGRLRVNATSRVGWWNLELNTATAVNWMRDLGLADPDALAALHLRGHSMPLLAPVVQTWAVEWLLKHRVDTWIIDPWGTLYDGEENSNSEVRDFLKALDEIKQRAGVRQLVLITHTGHQAKATDDVRTRGASKLRDWPDVLVEYRRGSTADGTADKRYMQAHGRDIDLPELGLDYEPSTRALTFAGGSRKDDASSARARQVREVVQRLLHTLKTQPNKGQVTAKLGGNATQAREALARAVSEGWVVETTLSARNIVYGLGTDPLVDFVSD